MTRKKPRRSGAMDYSGSYFVVVVDYLTRFNTTRAVPPTVEAGLVHFSSSPVRVNDRFCSVPSAFGYVVASILKIRVLSLTEYVPEYPRLCCTVALFSSGVPCSRLLAANLGRPGRVRRYAKRPFASKMTKPFGLGPNGWTFVPSGRTLSTETHVQVPTSCFAETPWAQPCDVANSITPIKAVTTDKTPIISRIDLFMDCLPRREPRTGHPSIPTGGADHRARKPVYTPLSCGGKLQPELPLVVLQGRAPCFCSDVRANVKYADRVRLHPNLARSPPMP